MVLGNYVICEELTVPSPLPFCWTPLLPLLLLEPSAESPARGRMRL